MEPLASQLNKAALRFEELETQLAQPETYADPDQVARLNREQKEALKKFSETLGENNYEKRRSFFGKKK